MMDIQAWFTGWSDEFGITVRQLVGGVYLIDKDYQGHHPRFIREIRENGSDESDMIFAVEPTGYTVCTYNPQESFLYFRVGIGYSNNYGFESVGYVGDVQPVQAKRKMITYWEV